MKKKRPSPDLPPLTPDDFDIPRQESFTPYELARRFGVSERTISRLIAEGAIAATGTGRHASITHAEVVAWFERQQRREKLGTKLGTPDGGADSG